MRSLLTMRPGMPDAAAGAHPFDVTYVNHALKTVRFLLDRVAGRVQREDGNSRPGWKPNFGSGYLRSRRFPAAWATVCLANLQINDKLDGIWQRNICFSELRLPPKWSRSQPVDLP